MSDTSKHLGEQAPVEAVPAVLIPMKDDASHAVSLVTESGDALQVVEERLTVSKQRKATGSVRVGTRTEIVEAVAEVDLDRYRVEVTRVPVGRVVDEAPLARAEADTTIIPVVEERLVMVKQLFLVEEIRIRHVLERKSVSEPVTLRRQRAVVERVAANGEVIVDVMSHMPQVLPQTAHQLTPEGSSTTSDEASQ